MGESTAARRPATSKPPCPGSKLNSKSGHRSGSAKSDVTTGVTGGNGSAPTVPFLHQDIYDEYLRWTRIVGDEEPYDTSKGIGIHDVLRAHFLIVDFFVESQQRGVGGVGPRDLNLLHSAINRQFVGFEG